MHPLTMPLDASYRFLAVILSYLVGSIPTALIVARARSVDILSSGSGNPGAVNVARAAGWAAGAVTLLGDAAKAFVPVLACRALLFPDETAPWCACGLAVMAGHIAPVFSRFRGGKGVACALGVMAALEPAAAAAGLVCFALVVLVSRTASLGSILGTAASLGALFILPAPSDFILTNAVILAVILLSHHENIRRLVRGGELRL
jgi:glycerol-3-phosphate acyltransferase PlsY